MNLYKSKIFNNYPFDVLKRKTRKVLAQFSPTLSQIGQDFWIYGEAFNRKRNGFFIDIGAYDGIYLSNTYILESRYKWNGICLEANPSAYRLLLKNRSSRCLCLNLCVDQKDGEVEFIDNGIVSGIFDVLRSNTNPNFINRHESTFQMEAKTLLNVLKVNNAPQVIEYLSIDVEGAEERILKQFDFNEYIFKSITIERPSSIVKDILKINNYTLIKEVEELDCLFIHDSFKEEYFKNLQAYYSKINIINKCKSLIYLRH